MVKFDTLYNKSERYGPNDEYENFFNHPRESSSTYQPNQEPNKEFHGNFT